MITFAWISFIGHLAILLAPALLQLMLFLGTGQPLGRRRWSKRERVTRDIAESSVKGKSGFPLVFLCNNFEFPGTKHQKVLQLTTVFLFFPRSNGIRYFRGTSSVVVDICYKSNCI